MHLFGGELVGLLGALLLVRMLLSLLRPRRQTRRMSSRIASSPSHLTRYLLSICCLAACGLLHCESQSFDPSLPLNSFLGSCLDQQWVNATAAKLNVSPTARSGAQQTLVNPFLHQAIQLPRFQIEDSRTSAPGAFQGSCIPATDYFHAAGSKLDVNNSIINNGSAAGSLVISIDAWCSNTLVNLVFAILASEIYGYPVSFYTMSDYSRLTEHMASVGLGECAPVHLDAEVWDASIVSLLAVYANESYNAGGIGYFGRAGLYTTKKLVERGFTTKDPDGVFNADYWMDYRFNEELINLLNASVLLSDASVYTAKSSDNCPDGTLGCRDSCSKTLACTLREHQGKQCLMVVDGAFYNDPGYLQAVLANLEIPAYFCFIGTPQQQQYVVEAYDKDLPVVFYHWQPDVFHYVHPGKFQRVHLPNAEPERVALSTGTFGENGYGTSTSNGVDVDFPSTKISKYSAKCIMKDSPSNIRVARFFSRFAFSDMQLSQLMTAFVNNSRRSHEINAVYFETACEWVKSNYLHWTKWLDRLPLCQLADVVVNCSSEMDPAMHTNVSTMSFAWKIPHPDDPSLPYTCDGGIFLPDPVKTRRECESYLNDPSKYTLWLQQKRPPCDKNFYRCTPAPCDNSRTRALVCSWIVPDPADTNASLQCSGGVVLPIGTLIDCDYTPTSSIMYKTMTFFASLAAVLYLVVIAALQKFRNAPIFFYSSPELLQMMPVGGLLVTGMVFVSGGQATTGLCVVRTAFLYLSATCVFGSIFIKMLNTYHLAISKSMRRATIRDIQRARSLRVFGILVLADTLVLAVRVGLGQLRAVDTPVSIRTVEFEGQVSSTSCSADGSSFALLLIFWNLFLLVVGMVLAFLNRRVKFDYTESFWVFVANSCVMILTILILLLVTSVQLSATARFLFVQGLFLICAFVTISFVLVPKFLAVHTASAPIDVLSDSRSTHSSGKDRSVVNTSESEPGASRVVWNDDTRLPMPPDGPRPTTILQRLLRSASVHPG